MVANTYLKNHSNHHYEFTNVISLLVEEPGFLYRPYGMRDEWFYLNDTRLFY